MGHSRFRFLRVYFCICRRDCAWISSLGTWGGQEHGFSGNPTVGLNTNAPPKFLTFKDLQASLNVERNFIAVYPQKALIIRIAQPRIAAHKSQSVPLKGQSKAGPSTRERSSIIFTDVQKLDFAMELGSEWPYQDFIIF
jgi:hypothetical protein